MVNFSRKIEGSGIVILNAGIVYHNTVKSVLRHSFVRYTSLVCAFSLLRFPFHCERLFCVGNQHDNGLIPVSFSSK